MYNDFIIVGPAADPAGIGGLTDAPAALAKIRGHRALFLSRAMTAAHTSASADFGKRRI